MERKPVDTYSYEALIDLMQELVQPKYRGQQLFYWLYNQGIDSYDKMTNIPLAMREQLAEELPLHFPTIENRLVSRDGTRKYVLRLADGALVETVGIPSHETTDAGLPKRLSVCVSTQVGCPIGCTFCATGGKGPRRLTVPGAPIRRR